VDDNARTQLAVVAAQARGISEALAHNKEEYLERDDGTNYALNHLLQGAHEVLGDSRVAKLLPKEVHSQSPLGIVPRTRVMAAAQQLAAALETLLAQEPGRVEQLEGEKQALEAKVVEAEARAVTIKDDELRERCVDLLLRPGKADTAVAAACTLLEDRLRNVTGLPNDDIDVSLVDKALKKREGKLVVSDVDAEQDGFHMLCRGVIGFFKNPTSHRVIEDYDLTRARQVVGLIDTLLQLLREAKPRTAHNVGT
jgi:uncharacterized protein (TIGR02391 family)